ncbi:MAG TPA: SDR family NAD(P)-dependent oxidoreductase, partial [candidate division Zixibacteria bacterium]
MSLEGKVALITGAAQGIGRAIALRLAQVKANVIIADLNFTLAQETASEIQNKGAKAIAFHADVSDSSQVEGLIKKVLENFTNIDILINNAGISKDAL